MAQRSTVDSPGPLCGFDTPADNFLAVVTVSETLCAHHLHPWFVSLVLDTIGPVTGIVDSNEELHVSVKGDFTSELTFLMNSFCRA